MACYSLILFLVLVVIISVGPVSTVGQDPGTVAQCVSRLVPLAPCGAFVQGDEEMPSEECCENLKEIYGKQPQCLCMLLRDPATLASFPAINTSLAIQLPALCTLQVDISVCAPGANRPVAPGSQVSLGSTGPNTGTTVNSTITASPVPRPSSNTTTQVLERNGATTFQTGSDFAVLIAIAIATSLLVFIELIF